MSQTTEPLPLTYLLSPTVDLDEIQLRSELVAARWTEFAGTCQKLVENHIETVQASTLGTLEKMRLSALEAAFLSSPARAESIEIH